MASNQYSYFLFVFLIKQTKCMSVNVNLPDITEKDFNMRSHLKYDNVWEYCSHRDEACKSNNTNICAVKMVNQKKFYKDFLNGCYLFLSNMCDHPEEEYFIVTGGSCDEYLATRRSGDGTEDNESSATDTEMSNNTDVTFGDNSTDFALRQEEKPFSPLYEVDMAFDYHLCPHSCPKVYSPICLNVNRGYGKYFKLMNFVNHCFGDLYYCKNWREFAPPPDVEDENVRASDLGWSFCGASRYIQFARFSEALSSIGHYGWLAGNQKFSHIMEPHERIPGFG